MWFLMRGADPPLPGLPDELQAVVRAVSRKTRLMHSERTEVARELAAHFRDGLEALTEAGESREEAVRTLLRDFGEPAMLAPMIGRGKRRCRSAAMKFVTFSVKGLCVIMLTLLLYVGWLVYGQIRPTENYLVILNADADVVPAEDRAWPIYREVLLTMTELPEQLKENPRDVRPGDERWPIALQWATENEGIVKDLHLGAALPSIGEAYGNTEALEFMIERAKARGKPEEAAAHEENLKRLKDVKNPDLISILLPAIGELRHASYVLLYRARAASAEGRVDDALVDLVAIHGTGRQLLARKTLIEQLVGASMVRYSLSDLRDVLSQHQSELTAGQISMLRSSSIFTTPPESFAMFTDGERLAMLDTIQRVFTDDGTGDGVLSLPEYQQYTSMVTGEAEDIGEFQRFMNAAMPLLHAGRKETLAKYEEVWADATSRLSKPMYTRERQAADAPIEAIINDPWLKVRFGLITKMLPSLHRADLLLDEAAMEQAATELTVAVLDYRLAKGSLPASLEALLPQFIDAVPTDIYDGKPLKYQRDPADANAFVLYSIGRNFLDDGAWDETIEVTGEPSRVPADIVFWGASSN